jgi:hypothetical protein
VAVPRVPFQGCPQTWIKTPSYLKGLAETRARAAGEVKRYEKIASDVKDLLRRARNALAACDLLIVRFDARLTPEDIQPIRPPKFYGGKRGQLRNTVTEILQREAPGTVTTSQIGVEIQIRFLLAFDTPAARTAWQCNSIGRLMRKMFKQGLVDRLHDPAALTEEGARWRWRSGAASSPDHLRELVEAQGGSVHQYDAAHD